MKQLDPKSVWMFFASFLLRTVAFLAPFVVVAIILIVNYLTEMHNVAFKKWVPVILLGILLVFIIYLIACYIWAKLSYKYYRYDLSDRGIKKESGVIWKQYVTIPYDRIQNVDIYRGVIARLLGLSDLQIHTAGAGGVALGEGRLPGLSKEDAEKMRDELIDRAKSSRNGQGL